MITRYLKFTVILLLFIAGCGLGLKRSVDNYRGDGIATFLEGPRLPGLYGVEIEFPPFDLSQNISLSYSLDGIPAGEDYWLYLAVPKPYPSDLVKKVEFSYKIKNGATTIKSASAPLSQLIDTFTQSKSRFYFPGRNNRITIPKGAADISLTIDSSSENMNQKVLAFVAIRRGGGK